MDMVSGDIALLAKHVRHGRVVLFHLSGRYSASGWQQPLAEVRSGLTEDCFPESWQLE
jgi:hypothetical protein